MGCFPQTQGSSDCVWWYSHDLDRSEGLAEARGEKIDIEKLIKNFHEMISYDVGEIRLKLNIDHFLELLRDKGLYE